MRDKQRYRLIGYGLGYDNPDRVPVDRNKLGTQVGGYIEAALTTTQQDEFFGNGGCLFDDYDVSSIDEATLLQMVRDNVSFYWRNRKVLEHLYETGAYTQVQCGMDFWLSRNGHGAGFFDRGWEDHWDELQQSAKGYGEVHLWVNENDEVAADHLGVAR